MKKEFVIRGQTASGETEVLEFGGKQKETKGMAYRLVEFKLYGSTGLGNNNLELYATVTAGKTAIAPTYPNFDNDGLIGTAHYNSSISHNITLDTAIVNDTFLITQNLILMVVDVDGGAPVNWQCRFEAVKMTNAEEASTNYKQFAIFDE